MAVGLEPITRVDPSLSALSSVFVIAKTAGFGVIGDGTTSDRSALNTLVNTTIALAGGTLYFSNDSGSANTDYLIDSAMTFPANVSLMFAPGSRLKVATGVTVTIVGEISETRRQIFSLVGTGKVLFTGNKTLIEVHPQWWGAVADGSTDCTEAIQAAINALSDSEIGGTVRLPAGVYVIGGALQDTSVSNAQIVLPKRTTLLSIRLAGAVPAQTIAFTSALTGSVLSSTLASGTGSIFGSKGTNSFPVSGTNYLSLHLEDLLIRTVANPTISALDLTYLANLAVRNVQIGAGDPTSITEPTTTTSYAIKLPPNNIPDVAIVSNVQIFGFYNGMLWGELASVDNLTITFCKVAMEIPTAFHPMRGGRIWVGYCPRAVKATGGNSHVQIEQLTIEHQTSPAWVAAVADIDDASDYMDGEIGFHLVTVSVGVTSDLIINGSDSCKLKLSQLYTRGHGPSLTVSSNELRPTHRQHTVGSGLIKTIIADTWYWRSGVFYLVTGATPFTTDTSDNIARSIAPAAGQIVGFTYSAADSKWHPSI